MSTPRLNYDSGRLYAKWGGMTVPILGGTLPWIDLNDKQAWRVTGAIEVDEAKQRIHAQQPNRAKAVAISDDQLPKVIKLGAMYDESCGVSFQAAKGQLSQVGVQFLSLDGAYGVPCFVINFGTPKTLRTFPPQLWEMTLQFYAPEPFLQNLTQQSQQANIAGSTGGSVTNINVNYPGNVRCFPKYVISIPASNTAPVSQIKVQNTSVVDSPGETLTITFATPLAAGTAWTLTIDSDGLHVTDQAGTEYDVSGSFPNLYYGGNPGGTLNTIAVTVTTSSGTLAAASTCQVLYNDRWEA